MNILVADDKPAVRDTLSTLLAAHGYHVDTAINGLDAFEKAQSKDYRLYIIDHLMPLMSGIQLSKNLKQLPYCKQIPILLMTTQNIDSVKKLPEYALFNRVIGKPIDESNFIKTLADIGLNLVSFERKIVN